ncbi:hypothetical protein [Dankookia sp. P2]|uniref:hypothetical protein n=1 Tax=Dankookia sp. P2 TaxID=3423955 RepID=UPI003D6754BD
MLGTIVNGERLPLRQYYLDHLRRPHHSSAGTAAMESDEVTVTLLRLMPIDAGDEADYSGMHAWRDALDLGNGR